MLDFAQARRMMVDGQLRTFDVNHIPLLAAMDSVPRERFVPAARESLAYSDRDLMVAEGSGERRFMLAPMVLARLVQALEIAPGGKVLDVACGLGYSSAVMARLGAAVIALDVDETIVAEARARLADWGATGIAVVGGALKQGYPKGAPYDAVLVNGAVETEPRLLMEQLADGGRLACVHGRGRAAAAMLYIRSGDAFGRRALFDAAAPVLAAFGREPGFVF